MTKQELIDRIKESTLVEKKVIANVLDCLADITIRELQAGNEVPLPGLGKLSVKEKCARKGRNGRGAGGY